MQSLTHAGQQLVNDLSQRYNISTDAVLHMLISVNNGSGTMAQFNSPELGGAGQWMRGGMTMVGDMFNQGLQHTVSNLCEELANGLATTQVFPEAPVGSTNANQWWPAELGSPFSSGGQNDTRYALFDGRIAVETQGDLIVYDTLDHQIGGVSQQQGGHDALSFNSQYGTFTVNSLPVISGQSPAIDPVVNQAPAVQTPDLDVEVAVDQPATDEIFSLISKLAELNKAGVLDNDEFATKKAELLARI